MRLNDGSIEASPANAFWDVQTVPVGDALGGLDEASVAHGRHLGRVEVLQWAQDALQVQLRHMVEMDKFADTRGLEEFLIRVQDELSLTLDGSEPGASDGGEAGAVAGLAPPGLGEPDRDTAAGIVVPEA